MSGLRKPPPPVLAALAGLQVISAVLAWRDLTRRAEREIRGPKRVWRIAITLNPGNSIAYWLLGRRR